eukprot:4542977-Pyramimonas_sp.AAC.1
MPRRPRKVRDKWCKVHTKRLMTAVVHVRDGGRAGGEAGVRGMRVGSGNCWREIVNGEARKEQESSENADNGNLEGEALEGGSKDGKE